MSHMPTMTDPEGSDGAGVGNARRIDLEEPLYSDPGPNGGDLTVDRTHKVRTFDDTGRGVVPASVTADATKFLRDDGAWTNDLDGDLTVAGEIGAHRVQVGPGGAAVEGHIGVYTWGFPNELRTASFSGAVTHWQPVDATNPAIVGGLATFWYATLSGNATIDSIGTGITGFQAGTGRMFCVINTSATYSLTLKHEHGGSNVSCRLTCPGAVDLVIGPGESRWLEYSTPALVDANSRFVVLGDKKLVGIPQDVTGDRAGNTALASLLTGLATAGLITDSTIAGSAPGGGTTITRVSEATTASIELANNDATNVLTCASITPANGSTVQITGSVHVVVADNTPGLACVTAVLKKGGSEVARWVQPLGVTDQDTTYELQCTIPIVWTETGDGNAAVFRVDLITDAGSDGDWTAEARALFVNVLSA